MHPAGAETTVLIVEDDAMVCGWIRLSRKGSEFRVVGEAESTQEAIALQKRRVPQLPLIDCRLADGVGTGLVRRLRMYGVDAPMVLMTTQHERGYNEMARDSGAQATVLKTGRSEELLDALRQARDGGRSFDGRHPVRPPGHGALSRREREVLQLVASGATHPQIAAKLDVGTETVKTLLARLFAKLGVGRRAEAVSAAHRIGLL